MRLQITLFFIDIQTAAPCALRGRLTFLFRLLYGALLGNFQLPIARFPLDPHHPIVVHSFCFQPRFESFAGIRAELGKHLSFEHVYENSFGAGRATTLHALSERLRTLAREAGECVLREVAWHESSGDGWVQSIPQKTISKKLRRLRPTAHRENASEESAARPCMLYSAAMGSQKRRWIEATLCVWIVAAQVWYYLQFKEQFRPILSPILHKLWH